MSSTMTRLPPTAHVALVRCRVRYLGHAAPTEEPDGIAAMQKPLHELHYYPPSPPVDSVIVAYTSGVLLESPAGSGNETWLPIQDMMECGAMRAVDRPPTSFVPLQNGKSKKGSGPALFAFVFRRKDICVTDCYAVECKSDQAALALLNACSMAHQNPTGWASGTDRPPPVSNQKQEMTVHTHNDDWDGAVARDGLLCGAKNIPREYYEKPPLNGYFYTPRADLIQKYNVAQVPCDSAANGSEHQCCAQPQSNMILIPGQQAPVIPPEMMTYGCHQGPAQPIQCDRACKKTTVSTVDRQPGYIPDWVTPYSGQSCSHCKADSSSSSDDSDTGRKKKKVPTATLR